MKLSILPIKENIFSKVKENMIGQDSNGIFKYKINLKTLIRIMICKIVMSQNLNYVIKL